MDWVAKWWADGAEDTLRVHYPLTSDSIVFDVGAYDGGWSADLARHTGVHPVSYTHLNCRAAFGDDVYESMKEHMVVNAGVIAGRPARCV